MEMKKYKLSEICRIASSKRIFESEYVERGVPFIRGQEISDGSILDPKASFECYISQSRYEEIKEKHGKPNKGDILITAVGTIGNLCYLDKDIDFYFKDGNVIWFSEIISSCDGKFLFHFMKSSYFKEQLKYFMIGAVQKALTIDMLKKVEVPLPPLPTQQKIAAVLSSLDDKIALNKKINAKLEAMAKRLYDYWFVQFDYPDKNGKPYKTSGGKMVWNEVLKREIPEGWEVKRLGEVCDFRNGINYEKNNSGDKIYKIVNVRNITATTFFLNQNDFDEICLQSKIADNYLIPEISILIARSGSPGATRVIMNVKNNVIFCGFIICMEKFTPKYKFYFTYFLKKLENTNATKTGGSILQNVSQDTLKRLSVIIPPKEMIDEFNEKILPIFNYQLTIQKEIQKLTKLRDRLLPLLMNGQVEVGTNNSSEFCNAKLGKQATACDMNGQVEVVEK